jgi:Domain of unknown function (DUF5665)
MEKSVQQQEQIKKLPSKKIRDIKKLPKDKVEQVEGLIDAIDALWLDEFMEYIKSPWKMIWPNFVAGVVRGFGALVWAALVITLIGWIFSLVIDLPLIGKRLEPYIEIVQTEFKKYTEATNYKEDFKEMKESLKNIETSLQK